MSGWTRLGAAVKHRWASAWVRRGAAILTLALVVEYTVVPRLPVPVRHRPCRGVSGFLAASYRPRISLISRPP